MVSKEIEKALKSIKVGKKYYVVGDNGGCDSYNKCRNCRNYRKPAHIIVTGIDIGRGSRCVDGRSSISPNHCSFDPRDLIPVNPDWKRRLE